MDKRNSNVLVELLPVFSDGKDKRDNLFHCWKNKDHNAFVCALADKPDLNHKYKELDDLRLIDVFCKSPDSRSYLQALIGEGVDVNKINKKTGNAAIHYAVESINSAALQILIDAGADINIQNLDGETPLHILIHKWENFRTECMNCLNMILEQPRRAINVPDNNGCTPIFLAAAQMENELVETLFEKCPDIDLDTFRSKEDNRTARDVLLSNYPYIEEFPGNWEPDPDRGVVDYQYRLFYFLSTGQEIRFCQTFREAMLQKIKQNEILLTCHDSHRYTYLQHASKKGLKKAVNVLLKFSSDVNFAPEKTESPIELAAKFGHPDVLSIFLNATDINLKPNGQGETLLHLVVRSNESDPNDLLECLRRLLLHPSMDVNARDFKGRTPLHFAVKYSGDECIFALIDNGARLDIPNNYKKTPLADISASTFRKYLDSKITTNTHLTKEHNFTIMFDYHLAAKHCKDHIYGISTDLLIAISTSMKLRNLISHPIFATIIYFKWHRIRLYFYINFFFYTLFCFVFTAYIFYGSEVSHNRLNISIPSKKEIIILEHNDFYYVKYVENFILLFIAFISFGEILQFLNNPKLYISSLENWVQIIVVLLVTTVIFSKCATNPDARDMCVQLNSTSILFLWFELFFVIGNHPKLSFFIDMFRTASTFLFQFLSVHTPLIIAFALSFYILFKEAEGPFSTVTGSIFKTLVMLTGEYDVDNVPLSSLVSYFIFCSFIFLVTIVLFNLLIGLAVSATRPIEDDIFLYRCIAQISIIVNFENVLFNDSHLLKKMYCFLTNCSKKQTTNPSNLIPILCIYPNKSNGLRIRLVSNDPERKEVKMKRLRFKLSNKIVDDANQILTNKQDAQKTNCDKMDEMKKQLESVQVYFEEEMKTMKTGLAQILEKLEFNNTEVDGDGQAAGHRKRRSRNEVIIKKLKLKLNDRTKDK